MLSFVTDEFLSSSLVGAARIIIEANLESPDGSSNRRLKPHERDNMIVRARWRCMACFLVLSSVAAPSVFAAEETAQEPPSQTAPDSRSYLPPWMQGQGGGQTPENAGAPAGASGATSAGDASAATGAGSRRETRSAYGAHRPRRTHRGGGNDFFRGFAGLFD